MKNRLDQEEAKLRRRLLFRILRGFNFDAPRFGGETISDPIPRHLLGRDADYFNPSRSPLSPGNLSSSNLSRS
ncbi:peptidyl-tRNA hydrolase [Pseudophaeobacter sp.]|uniref:peptidyl-tRNA hydrolase n=1 Tax=Pseudophaeobacter sp. TaxID=1971739 RepID=UPI00329902FE